MERIAKAIRPITYKKTFRILKVCFVYIPVLIARFAFFPRRALFLEKLFLPAAIRLLCVASLERPISPRRVICIPLERTAAFTL